MADQPDGRENRGIRIGPGELRHPGDTARYRLRVEWLEVVRELCPQVLADLRALADLPDRNSAQRQAIITWATQHHLIAPPDNTPPRWIRQTAASTLMAVKLKPAFAGWAHHAAADFTPTYRTESGELSEVLTDAEMTLPASWEPFFETREKKLADIDARMDEIEALALSRGAVKADWKRERLHLEWLARYQVNGESPESIATRTHVIGVVAVRKALRETAQAIGIALRPWGVKRGRPRKSPPR